MARPIWKGQIAFGLVNVPITLYSAEERTNLSFKLIDSRNSARIRYERINEETGEEVPWDVIVKGYEYDSGNYVLLSDEELERASVELTRTIEIEQFVDLDQIEAVYFEKPYYLVPGKGGEKGYVILREAMEESGKAGIARVVIRSRQSIGALTVRGDGLVLNILRYAHELRDMDDYNIPGQNLKEYKVSSKEVDMAKQLLESMASDFEPEGYKDEYYDVLMDMIKKKIKSGHVEAIEDVEEPEEEEATTLNFMDVLKKSVDKAGKPRKSATTKKTATRRKKRTPRRKHAAKKRAAS